MGSLEENWFFLGLAGSMGCDPPRHGQNWKHPRSWPEAPGVRLGTRLENQFGKAVSKMSSSCCVL